MASEYTPNYNLDLYVSTDKPNLRDQYNAAMGKIDTQMKANADGVTNANANVLTMQTTVSEHTEKITALETEQGTISSDVESMQGTVSQHTSQISALQSTVSQHTQQITDVDDKADAAVSTANSANTTAGQANSTAQSAQSTANNVLTQFNDYKKTELVVFGDSWAAASVSDVKWPNAVAEQTGLKLHNYAINGASFSNGSMNTQVSNFIADDSYEKDNIAAVVCVFGVNDAKLNSVAAATEAQNIITWLSTVTPHIPDTCPIIHIPNWSYGDTEFSIYQQGRYWMTDVFNTVKAAQPRYRLCQCFSWLACEDFNTSNYYHITANASATVFANNVAALLGYGNIIERPTFTFINKSAPSKIRIFVNLGGDGLVTISVSGVTVTSADSGSGSSFGKRCPCTISLWDFAICTSSSGSTDCMAGAVEVDENYDQYDYALPASKVGNRAFANTWTMPYSSDPNPD